jgi:hypothetical protein
MIKLGSSAISKVYFGANEITKAYLGSTEVYSGSVDLFIIEVDTTKAGSNSDQFQFTGAEGDYNVVAKQSGVIVQTFNNLSDEETITFSDGSGIYVLEVEAKEIDGFNRIRFANSGDNSKITDIKQWGSIVWSSFESSFWGCQNMLITSTDVPNLTNVGSLDKMFANASLINPDTSNWNLINATNMRLMFLGTSNANTDARNWNPINATNMDRIFDSSNLSTANLDACYINWSQLSLQSNVSFGAGRSEYSSGAAATGRQKLIDDFNWTISDGGEV